MGVPPGGVGVSPAWRRDSRAGGPHYPWVPYAVDAEVHARYAAAMARQAASRKGGQSAAAPTPAASVARPSALLDTRIIPARRDCGDCLDQLSSEPRPSGSGPHLRFEDRHASTQAYIDYMRPRCVELARVLKKTGSFYYRCSCRNSTRLVRIRYHWN